MTWQPPIGKDISSTLLLWQTISDSADWKVWCKAQIMVGRHNWWYIDEQIHNYCRNAVLAVASIAIVKQHVLIFTKKDNISWNRIYVHLLIGLTTDVNCAQNPPTKASHWKVKSQSLKVLNAKQALKLVCIKILTFLFEIAPIFCQQAGKQDQTDSGANRRNAQVECPKNQHFSR